MIAHNKLTPARMEYGEIEILDANINRSPSSYLRNPPEERARYETILLNIYQPKFKVYSESINTWKHLKRGKPSACGLLRSFFSSLSAQSHIKRPEAWYHMGLVRRINDSITSLNFILAETYLILHYLWSSYLYLESTKSNRGLDAPDRSYQTLKTKIVASTL